MQRCRISLFLLTDTADEKADVSEIFGTRPSELNDDNELPSEDENADAEDEKPDVSGIVKTEPFQSDDEELPSEDAEDEKPDISGIVKTEPFQLDDEDLPSGDAAEEEVQDSEMELPSEDATDEKVADSEIFETEPFESDKEIPSEESANDNVDVPEKRPSASDDDSELPYDKECCEMASSSEDEFPAEESDDDDSEEEFSESAIVDLLCDVDDIDKDLHECIKLFEVSGYERGIGLKWNHKSGDSEDDCPANKKRKMTNGADGCEGHDLLVTVDSKTVVGKSKDGSDFIWRTVPCGTAVPEADVNPEPVGCAVDAQTPLECFTLFFTEEMIESLIPRTNEKIAEFRQKIVCRSKTYAQVKSSKEFKALFGLLLLAAVRKDNHLPLSAMFDVGSSGIRYRSVMSPHRFRFLLQCLQFGRNPSRPGDGSSPVAHLWEWFLRNCRSNYEPGRNVTVGDRVVRFAGKSPFKLAKSPEEFGLRSTLMVDSSTKYFVDAVPNPLTSESLLKLSKSVKSSNINVTFENPVSVQWVTELRRNGLTAVGVVTREDSELPKEILDPDFQSRMLRSSFFIHREEMSAVSYKTRSTEVVCYVSSMHSEPRLSNKKPEILLSYNSKKDAVRAFNKIVDNVSCARKTKRWTLGFFFNMLSIACANAYVVYLHNVYRRLCYSVKVEEGEGCPEAPLSRLDFVARLADQLTSEWVRERLTARPSLMLEMTERVVRSLADLTGDLGDGRAQLEASRSTVKSAQRPKGAPARGATSELS